MKHDDDFFFDDAFYEDFHKKNNTPQKNPQSPLQPTTNNNIHNKIQDHPSQSQAPQPQPQPQQPKPQSQSQSQPKPKPKPKSTASTPDYKKLLQSIRDYEIEEEEGQQQQEPQESQPQPTTNNKHLVDHQGQYLEPMGSTPPPISNSTIATTSTAATAPVISTAATSINSGAVKNPQPSPPEEAIRRLNQRLELYQLENSRVIPGDGNCQMYALSDQIFGDLKHSFEIRRAIATWLIKNKNLTLKNGAKISQFAHTTNWNKYCNQMARRGTWGDHLTLIAAAEVYKSKITIISSVESNSSFFIEIVPSSIENDRAIILSHHAEEHYGSVRPMMVQDVNY
ncbi:hypothetical protein DICPUDRAFT_160229 [Dictyostelium purpureum]|uniref:OTU domain-containing protein n=1 Tax=Dictyostelium purpureum TaxID=5786 RepID=F1A5Y9_DICPU|nr:uncharacterized protein DICPUDRAFT_160229 [Dictyostelium purpureum]EGC28392.1 hypothetical protein DICPUDRAFT_160229 [Dictyostelium purpureum]|eukprot:XP_003295083.1 hypothetical protein DICPUDRAFT_160229 [Dictyostelium purpureum]